MKNCTESRICSRLDKRKTEYKEKSEGYNAVNRTWVSD